MAEDAGICGAICGALCCDFCISGLWPWSTTRTDSSSKGVCMCCNPFCDRMCSCGWPTGPVPDEEENKDASLSSRPPSYYATAPMTLDEGRRIAAEGTQNIEPGPLPASHSPSNSVTEQGNGGPKDAVGIKDS